jgi:restriction system protein
MAIPDYQSLMRPVLAAATKGEVRIGDLVDRLAAELGLSADEAVQLLPSGRGTMFGNRVHWAKTYLVKAGLLEGTRRGHFTITERGRQAIISAPERIDNNYLRQFGEFRKFTEKTPETIATDQQAAEVASAAQSRTPDEIMRAAHRQIEASLAQDLLDRIRVAPPTFFELLVIRLLRAMGYGGSDAEAGRALGRSGDDGVDGVIDQDRLGLDQVYVQAKRYAPGNNIGSGAIRDFFGSLDRHQASKGLFITTSSFSASARETASYLSKRLVLIDGEQLSALMIRYNVGCRVEEALHIKKIDEDFFE